MNETKQIKELKKGEFFRRLVKGQPGARVWVRGEYDRSEKAYLVWPFDDVNDWHYMKPTKAVNVGFEF